MTPSPQLMPKASKAPSATMTLFRSVVAVAVLVGGIAGGVFISSGTVPWGLYSQGDDVTELEQQARKQAFSALTTLSLARVPDSEVDRAVDSMQLSPADKSALVSELERKHSVAAAPLAPPKKAAIKKHKPAAPAAASSAEVSRLAWITVWDTDAQDGDAVRIDSQGYSRTVTLTKEPVTFAIPVPASGSIQISGVRDGEGGGITVGLSSGAVTAILPIMSVDQVLNLKAQLN